MAELPNFQTLAREILLNLVHYPARGKSEPFGIEADANKLAGSLRLAFEHAGAFADRSFATMSTPERRYQNDRVFRQLVDILELQIREANYTASELRDAAILAAIHYESTAIRRHFFIHESGIKPAGVEGDCAACMMQDCTCPCRTCHAARERRAAGV